MAMLRQSVNLITLFPGSLLMSSADNFCKLFGPRSGPTELGDQGNNLIRVHNFIVFASPLESSQMCI